MSATEIALQQSQRSGKRKKAEGMSAEVSPDSKCPICLDTFHNISYVNRCLHKFCFRCILEWSKNKAECPLCKQPFNSIYHSIKSDEDFQKYELKQHVDNSSFGYFEGVRFRYRTTLTGIRRQMHGRTSPPPDNGVMFEGSTNPPQQRQDRYIRRMMMRLAAKRRAANEGRAVTNVREQEMINFRRELYRRGVRIRSVRDGGRCRDTSAEFYRRNPACLHRLVPWLKRELAVLYGAHGSLVNIVQHIIMSRITCYDMAEGAIHEELRPFLQGRTEHFLHEFISFAQSPFNMEAYDQHAVYDCPAPSSNEGSSSNSSVIAISEDEDNVVEMDHPRDSTSALSHSVWDDETPGPSYSTVVEQGRAEHLSVLDSDSDSSSEEETQELGSSPQPMSLHNQIEMTVVERKKEEFGNDDCVIVGFVKPTADRTPELVQLSSDSDHSSSEDTKDFPRQPQHIRFPSCSPAASQSSDSSRAARSETIETDSHHQLNSREQCSSLSGRHKTSNKTDSVDGFRERQKSKDRDHRRKKKKSRSRDHRSPVMSHSSVSSHSTEISHSYSIGRELSKHDRSYDKKDSGHRYQSYSHYRRERNGSVTHYTQRQSYYYSTHKYSDLYSRSRSRSKDSRRRDRRRARSRTRSSSCSPSARRESQRDKPGGKRKYKTRHLEEPSKKSPDREDDSMPSTKHKKKHKEKHHKKSRERSKKTSGSGSVELVGEEKAHERSKHHKKKKKHKKKNKRHKSVEHKARGSPAVITIDSESDMNEDISFNDDTNDQVNNLPPD